MSFEQNLDNKRLCEFERYFLKTIDFELFALSNPSTFLDFFQWEGKCHELLFETADRIVAEFWEGE